ncbi:DUF4297 domain-containing protein [Priestia aryabhattai]|uniref:DUF4297 domain-containing protein n=1 Tax=Priestia aryabhattai TaxID=412384 RepID=UPI001CD65D02|nr:DUF4297 domain-containing protein [Priestia aryabhattai]MCA1049375.1 DUF4297 domain-containing protein [Priestia aryabhattai]
MNRNEVLLSAIKKTEEELNKDINLVISEKCKGKGAEEISDFLNLLFEAPPEETGGQNAITGFYFQLLCTLYYLAEVIEGKWDYIILELHQDIIVGNDSAIKFIQVKSQVLQDREPIVAVTDTNLYLGWIQKLLYMGKFFPKGQGVQTQFELITNYMIKNSPKVKMEHYLYNNKFELEIDDKDDLLKKVIEYQDRGVSEGFNFENDCNESIKDLLSRFSINPKAINPSDFNDFFATVSYKLGKLINKSAGVPLEDLNFLLGELCYRCNHTTEGSLLAIEKEEANELLQILKKRASQNLKGFFENNNNDSLIDEIITNFSDEFSELQNPNLMGQLQDEFESFRCELKRWANEDISVVEMVHRYLEGKSFSLKHQNIPPLKLRTKLTEIFKTFFLLNLLFDKELKVSTKFKGMLIKESEKKYISIVGLEMGQTVEEGIEKLSLILDKTSKDEKIILLMQGAPHTIFQGPYDDDFDAPETYSIDQIMEPYMEEMEKGKSLNEVDWLWTLVPGAKLVGILKKVGKHPDITTFKGAVKEKWQLLL